MIKKIRKTYFISFFSVLKYIKDTKFRVFENTKIVLYVFSKTVLKNGLKKKEKVLNSS